jgi:flagellar basal-body rod modification protein FlgD
LFQRVARRAEVLAAGVSPMTVSSTGSPNGTSSSSSNAASNGAMTSADFLSLLVSELQNQDPMNATSVTDFINQMTQYVNVASQQAINTSLGSLAGSFTSLVTLNSVNYIGHNVTAATDTAVLSKGSATFNYSLSSDSADVEITVTDSAGNKVLTKKTNGESGSNSFTWDGKDSDGKQLDDGKYKISVTATDAVGNSVFKYTSITGTVTGIDTSTSTPSLTVNGVSVSANNIIGVSS